MNIKPSYFPGIFLLFLSPLASAQKLQGFNIDVSLAKYGSEIGPDKSKVFYGPLLFLNAVKLGVPLNAKNNLRAGFRRLPIQFVKGDGKLNERLDNRGFEVTLGLEQKIGTHSKVTLFPETGMFYDYATIKGDAEQDGEIRKVHHKRQYKGIYHEAKFAYPLSKHVSMLTGIRFKFGHIASNHVSTENPDPTTFQESSGYKFTFDQVSTISIRYTL